MFDFPDSPSDGERVLHPNGRLYEYAQDRSSWVIAQDDLATLTTRVNALENLNFIIFE
jgi:hypothetical protein